MIRYTMCSFRLNILSWELLHAKSQSMSASGKVPLCDGAHRGHPPCPHQATVLCHRYLFNRQKKCPGLGLRKFMVHTYLQALFVLNVEGDRLHELFGTPRCPRQPDRSPMICPVTNYDELSDRYVGKLVYLHYPFLCMWTRSSRLNLESGEADGSPGL